MAKQRNEFLCVAIRACYNVRFQFRRNSLKSLLPRLNPKQIKHIMVGE